MKQKCTVYQTFLVGPPSQRLFAGLVSRVLLLSGSALSPGALAPDAALAREHTAQALRCLPESEPSGEHW